MSIPAADASPEDWAKFYRAIGAPENAEGYELPVPEGEDAAFSQTAAQWMAEAGLLPQQAKALAEKWNAFVAEQKTKGGETAAAAEAARVAAQQAEATRQDQALRNEWGAQHDANLSVAKRAAQQFLSPHVKAEGVADVMDAIEAKVGYAATIKFFHAIGKGLMTGQAHGLGGEGGQGSLSNLTPQERLAAAYNASAQTQ